MGKKIVAVVMLVAQIITGNISSELANGVKHHYTDDTMLKEISFAEVKDEDTELRVIYKVYTLQNVEGLDFYVVQAEVTGLPGADLDGDYESQYEGEKMSVNIEGAFNTIEKDVTISGGLSWTFDTYASYTLDSLWTAQEKIALDKSFTCTP